MKGSLLLVIACCAIRTIGGEPGNFGDTSGGPRNAHYTCIVRKGGKGVSIKRPIKVKNKRNFRECQAACTERKKKIIRIDGVVFSRKTGCVCLVDMDRIDYRKIWASYKSCHLKRNEPNELNGINKKVKGNEAVDLSYQFFKDVHCDTTWTKVGCYNVTHRDRFLLSYRNDIEWSPKRLPQFSTSLVCACAEAARLNDVKYFATHFWGECWEIDPEDFAKTGTEGCMLADGQYKNKCSGVDYAGECVGVTSYFIYTNIGSATEGDKKKKKRQSYKRGIPKRDAI